MNFSSLGQFAGFLGELANKAMNHRQRGLEEAARIVQREAQGALGTYDYGWPQLAESTKADRVRRGFTENDPGVRSGEMRASIHTQTHGGEASVGSDDIHLVYFEKGTVRQPPRPVLEEAARRKEREVQQILARGLLASIVSSVRAP